MKEYIISIDWVTDHNFIQRWKKKLHIFIAIVIMLNINCFKHTNLFYFTVSINCENFIVFCFNFMTQKLLNNISIEMNIESIGLVL